MTNKNKLEEIFWKEGKFVNKDNEEINPKPIGEPKIIEVNLSDESYTPEGILFNLEKSDRTYEEVNAYIKGDKIRKKGMVPSNDIFDSTAILSFNFFKI